MSKSEIIYQGGTLFISMYGTYNIKEIKNLKRKMYNIIDTYGINDIVINKKGTLNMDNNAFYDMLDDYDIKYGGNLMIEE